MIASICFLVPCCATSFSGTWRLSIKGTKRNYLLQNWMLSMSEVGTQRGKFPYVDFSSVVTAGKRFASNGTKYYIAYDIVDEASDSVASNFVFKRKFQNHNATSSASVDCNGVITWKHNNRIEYFFAFFLLELQQLTTPQNRT